MVFPPIHPIFVNFTAALVPASFLSDTLARVLRKSSLASAGWWMLLYATLATPITVITGWYWFRQMPSDDPSMAIHKWLGGGLAIAFVGLLYWRWRFYRSGNAPGWVYLACIGFTVSALIIQGHLGGAMSFATDAQSLNTPLAPQPSAAA
jgi:uncharacterized membrane protein